MRGTMLRALIAAVLIALAGAAPAHAFPFDPQSATPPEGLTLSPRAAVARAASTRAVVRERRRGPLKPQATFDPSSGWTIDFKRGPRTVVEVKIDDATQTVRDVYTGLEAQSPLARGEHGSLKNRLHMFMLLAGVAFLLPFIDPRRPFRMLHLDLAAMLALGLYHWFFARGDLTIAIPLVYPVLLYLLARVLWVMLRPSRRAPEALVPLMSVRGLAIALAAAVAARVAINIFGGFGVMEGGYDSVWGADTITGGWQLYTPASFPLNAYGPVMYLAYVPFEWIFPIGPGWQSGSLPAAHAAAITFDLATVCGLYVLGRRLREGSAGTMLGLALAFAWATYPWTLAVAAVSTNDGLVPALLVWALVLVSSRPVRGALLGLATAAKFFPLPLVPALARSDGEDLSLRSVLGYAAVITAVIALAIVPYLPDPGGIRQFLDLTVNAQVSRSSLMSLWGLHPSLEWLQTVMRVFTVVLAVALFFVPRRRPTAVLAGAIATVIIAQELSLDHWYYLYASWFAPFVLIALFADSRRVTLPRA